ncbi:MAG: alpha/beta fold hydrolase [Betaproteobacteria bacterium]|nr:MAG: alpha/beta fold hydrolase [Betaproteobacteria bacterium]
MRNANTMMRGRSQFLLAVFFCIAPAVADVQSEAGPAYSEVFYLSGNLRIQAYLYKPDGDGPFPVVIYNHGSRDGREAASVPFQYIGKMLTRAGYVVLVPERRGYGKSDGSMWRQDVGNDPSSLITRLQAEADDVLAAIDYLRTVPSTDTNRIGIMGWSFGGIITMLAASRSAAFVVAVDQAGGALTWDGNAYLRRALVGAAEKSVTPTLFMVAMNDRTTLSITTLVEIFKTRDVPHRMIIYEPFTPAQRIRVAAPGHALFSEQGASVWESDLVQFLGRYLGATVSDKRDGAAAPKAQQ